MCYARECVLRLPTATIVSSTTCVCQVAPRIGSNLAKTYMHYSSFSEVHPVGRLHWCPPALSRRALQVLALAIT